MTIPKSQYLPDVSLDGRSQKECQSLMENKGNISETVWHIIEKLICDPAPMCIDVCLCVCVWGIVLRGEHQLSI